MVALRTFISGPFQPALCIGSLGILPAPGKALRQSNGLAISSLQHIEPNAEEAWEGWHQVWYTCGKVTHSEAAGLKVAHGPSIHSRARMLPYHLGLGVEGSGG